MCTSKCLCATQLHQALTELTVTLQPFLKANPDYQRALDVVQIPERVIQFRIVWEDDQGKLHVNRGYRVQVRLLFYHCHYTCH